LETRPIVDEPSADDQRAEHDDDDQRALPKV
jgi:hypothetical protein